MSRSAWHRGAPHDRLGRLRRILFPLWVLGATLLVLFPIYLIFMVSVAPGIAIFGERPALLLTHPTLRFWMRRGVDGFRMDVIGLIYKDPLLRDNPPNSDAGTPDPVPPHT